MRRIIPFVLLCSLQFNFSCADAQPEVAHISTKGYSSLGVGGFFNFGFLLNRGDAITWEVGVLLFAHAVSMPDAVGYRHTFNHKGYGLYVEPQIAFTYGGAYIPKKDSLKFPALMDGQGHINQPELSGFSPSLIAGYIFPGKFRFNIGLRYEHIFTYFGGPGIDMFSLRLSRSIIPGRSRWYHERPAS